MSATRYEFLQHMTSGDVFAVAFDRSEQVTASFGPVPFRELNNDPAEFAGNMDDGDNDWFNNGNEFRLLDRNEAMQKANA